MFSSKRNRRHSVDIWPGFVDALATVLMVIIFVLMAFVVAQLYLTDALSSKEEDVAQLQKKVQKLSQVLSHEQESKNNIITQKDSLEKMLEVLHNQIHALNLNLNEEVNKKDEAFVKQQSLQDEVDLLQSQLNRLLKALEEYEESHKEKDLELKNISEKLNKALLEKVEELNLLTKKLDTLEKTNQDLATENEKNKNYTRINQYRSEFFSKLQQAIGDREDIRIVGDRFVLQSEVLFDKASAELGNEGRKKLDQLAEALKQISSRIPKNIPWILRIDGHTDQLPIHNQQFASNWELSSARAISVVKYLISKGISENNLVAAGFGEHQPLIQSKQENELARNRRIEFKLDQR